MTLDVGVHSITLTVTDNDGAASAPATVTITVNSPTTPPPGNNPPVANAGPDQPDAITGNIVVLDGSGSSDPDFDALTYAWTLTRPTGSGAVLSDTTAVSPTFTADVDGSYVVQLIVNDGTVDSAPDTVAITATAAAPGNQAPVASFTYTCDSANFTCDLDASASDDADGRIVTYAWDFGDGNSGSSGPMISHDYSKQGTYTVVLIVTDDNEQGGTASTDMRVPKKGTTSGGTDGGGSFCDAHPTHKKCL